MKILHKNQSRRKINNNCIFTKYDLENTNISFVIADVSGRLPESGRVVNSECDELIYISEGSGHIEVNGTAHDIHEGDAVFIEAGDKFFWEGNMKLFITCRPAWKIDQHQHVD